MMTEQFLIAAFRSRQAVIRLEGQMKRAGARTQIVSTPRAVAIGCGLSVRFEEKDLPLVRNLCRMEQSTFLGIFRVENVNGRAMVHRI